jgi:hypothetical protein
MLTCTEGRCFVVLVLALAGHLAFPPPLSHVLALAGDRTPNDLLVSLAHILKQNSAQIVSFFFAKENAAQIVPTAQNRNKPEKHHSAPCYFFQQ